MKATMKIKSNALLTYLIVAILIFFQAFFANAELQNVSCVEGINFNLDPIFRLDSGVSSATGFFVSKDGLFLTNQHVIDDDFGTKKPQKDSQLQGIISFYKTECNGNLCDNIEYEEEPLNFFVDFELVAFGDETYNYVLDDTDAFITYDFALLRVKEFDSISDNGIKLNTRGYLKLNNLIPAKGDTLQFAGFPNSCDNIDYDPMTYNLGAIFEFEDTDHPEKVGRYVRFSATSGPGASGSPVFDSKNNLVALLNRGRVNLPLFKDYSEALFISSIWNQIKQFFPPTPPIITLDKPADHLSGVVRIAAKTEEQQGEGITKLIYKIDGQEIETVNFNNVDSVEHTIIWDSSKYACYSQNSEITVEAYDNDSNDADSPTTPSVGTLAVAIMNNPVINIVNKPVTLNKNTFFDLEGYLTADGNGIDAELVCAAIGGTASQACANTAQDGYFSIDTLQAPSNPGTYVITIHSTLDAGCPVSETIPISVVDPATGYDLAVSTFTEVIDYIVEPGESIQLSANFVNNGDFPQELSVNWYFYPPGSGTPSQKFEGISYGEILPTHVVPGSQRFTLGEDAATGFWNVMVLVSTDKDEDLSNNMIETSFYVGDRTDSFYRYTLHNEIQREYTAESYSGYSVEVKAVQDSDCRTLYSINGNEETLYPNDMFTVNNEQMIFIHDGCSPVYNDADWALFKLFSSPPDYIYTMTAKNNVVYPGGNVVFQFSEKPRNCAVISEYKDGSIIEDWNFDTKNVDGIDEFVFNVPEDAVPKQYEALIKFDFYDVGEKLAQKVEFEVLSKHDVRLSNLLPVNGFEIETGKVVSISADLTSVKGIDEIAAVSLVIKNQTDTIYTSASSIRIIGTTTAKFQTNWDTIGIVPGSYTVELRVDINDDSDLSNNFLSSSINIVEASVNPPPLADSGGPYEGQVYKPVLLNADNSSDDGSIVQYEWDLDGDGVYETVTTEPTFSHTWTEVYSGKINLKVTDNLGAFATTDTTVIISLLTTLIGDLNEDGVVDIFDLVLVSGSFGRQTGDSILPAWIDIGDGSAADLADINNDGLVNTADLELVSGHFGEIK